ncbi:NAD(P)-dependent dehydrogenase, short-chain alcohol dehydrogenase family [Arboricoccus pini]|uniref:NAD(P)-dependent dehydrogenase, short-chain alcohol dehydrogenase family n=1 Tax=Arboricoccus pini TaxID=1963835 RepID=A0A212PZ40_9PROT|nr:SDR family NAD(P)-dependent oxidoreductase [Arboricoccus pini]SNB52326.1 NAD(P)-dependent dehydrogenase, short-chain alcohol dehydrogenase family [Arboricoccus pini]
MNAWAQRGPLSGLTVLVTGGSGGIGRCIVLSLAEAGARPIVHYGRDAAGAELLLAEIGGMGWTIQADLSDPAGASALFAQALARAGRIHGLVNNAGSRKTAALGGSLEAWQSAWDADLRLNLLAPADLCRAAILHFQTAGGGRIVNIASRAAQRGYAADFMPYGAAKAGLINLTKSIAREFGGQGIEAVTIAPGFVRTAMADEYVRLHGEAAVGDIPIGAMVEPAEIGQLVAFVLQPGQRSLNGATLDVNGGSYLR